MKKKKVLKYRAKKKFAAKKVVEPPKKPKFTPCTEVDKAAYRQGKKDATKFATDYSMWFAKAVTMWAGILPINPTALRLEYTDVKDIATLKRISYARGYKKGLQLLADERGITLSDNVMDWKDIGK